MARDRENSREGGNRDNVPQVRSRFPERKAFDWIGPIVDYKEVDLLRKFMTTSSKMMSRRRGMTNAQEQKAVKLAIKRARFLALLPYAGS